MSFSCIQRKFHEKKLSGNFFLGHRKKKSEIEKVSKNINKNWYELEHPKLVALERERERARATPRATARATASATASASVSASASASASARALALARSQNIYICQIPQNGIPRNSSASDFTQPPPRGICAIPQNDVSRNRGGGWVKTSLGYNCWFTHISRGKPPKLDFSASTVTFRDTLASQK